MEQKKFRLRLNIFDGIVLLAALAVGAFLLWNAMKPEVPQETVTTNNSTVRFTVRVMHWSEGTSALIQKGDQIADNIKNYVLGEVVDVQAVPCRQRVPDRESLRYVWTEVEGFEDVLVTLESPCNVTERTTMVDGAYELRVGDMAYLRGVGYMGSGPVVAIEVEEAQG